MNELSSPVSVTKIDEESNSSQSQDGDSQDFKDSSAIQYSTGNCWDVTLNVAGCVLN